MEKIENKISNMDIYNKVKSVPDNAKKAIEAGRLKGKYSQGPVETPSAQTSEALKPQPARATMPVLSPDKKTMWDQAVAYTARMPES